MNDDDLRKRLNRTFGEPPAARPDELARILSAAEASTAPLHLWMVAAASLAFAIAVVTLVSPAASRTRIAPIGYVTDPYDESLDDHRQLALAIARSSDIRSRPRVRGDRR